MDDYTYFYTISEKLYTQVVFKIISCCHWLQIVHLDIKNGVTTEMDIIKLNNCMVCVITTILSAEWVATIVWLVSYPLI